jgi:DNA repair exonuclease SbcCD ATPase subunit
VEPLPRVQKLSEEHERPQDSGLGSSPALTHQYDVLARELEQARQKNAWFTSELALARKSGYQSRDSPILDDGSTGSLNDDDRPLVEALLKMRAELGRVQETIDEQSRSAAERIAEMEKQRDVAINEAVFAKAKLAGQNGSPRPDGSDKSARTDDISRRLATALEAHNELNRRYEILSQEVEAEKKAREFAEDTAEAAAKRVTELDANRQQHAIEIANLRAELHESQTVARAASADHSEISSKHKMLALDHDELTTRFQTALTASSNHTSILASLKDAVAASSDKAQLMEKKLEEERAGRADLERQVRELNAQQAEHASQLENSSRALRDAEELAQTHAEEARTHRSAVLAGLGHVTERDVNGSQANDQRIVVLQEQVEAANALARQYQAAADTAADKLRSAEERIAGLEAYQEQASREGLSIRKQLQTTMKENNKLTSEKAALEQKMERHKLETNALSVQHASLKDILGERGVNASEVRRSRAIDSPSSARFSTPDPHRFRELEQNYETTLKNHDELRTQYDEVSERNEKMRREYEEKLSALDNDHQHAVKYLRGTEKMLSKLKQELQRVKTENSDLKKKVDKAKDESESSRDLNGAEAAQLRQELAAVQASLKSSVGDLESQILAMQNKLHSTEADLAQASTQHATTAKELSALQTSHTQTRNDFERLQKENNLLEHRAKDAEDKVQLLLDQVEHSVDNYRRQSRISAAGGGGGPNGASSLHTRTISADTSTTQTSHHNHHHNLLRHSRGTSLGGESAYDDVHDDTSELTTLGDASGSGSGGGGGGEARNSLALDSLANELETLRSHWETAKNYRLSDRFDFERSSGANGTSSSHAAGASGGAAAGASGIAGGASIANWRHALGLGDDDDDDEDEEEDDEDDDHERVVKGHTPTTTAAAAGAAAGGGAAPRKDAVKEDGSSETGPTPRLGMI